MAPTMVKSTGRQKRRQAFRPVNPQRIGPAIRQYRIAADMTQAELAERAFVAQITISRWESGTRIPGGPELLDLMELLGIRRDELV